MFTDTSHLRPLDTCQHLPAQKAFARCSNTWTRSQGRLKRSDEDTRSHWENSRKMAAAKDCHERSMQAGLKGSLVGPD